MSELDDFPPQRSLWHSCREAVGRRVSVRLRGRSGGAPLPVRRVMAVLLPPAMLGFGMALSSVSAWIIYRAIADSEGRVTDIPPSTPMIVFVLGAIVSILLAILTRVVCRRQIEAAQQASHIAAQYERGELRWAEVRHHAERALADLSLYRYALDQHSIVAVTDSVGRITYVNDLFVEISGFRRDELIGRTHAVVNSGRHPKAFWTAVWRTISRGKVWHGEVCNRRKDGSLYWVDTTIAPFCDAAGRITQYVSIRTDITARKAAEAASREARAQVEAQAEQLEFQAAELRTARELSEAANHAKSAFLANMSHEIRTPLTAILGYAEVLRDDLRTRDPLLDRESVVETICSAGKHLQSLIEDILDLSKIEADRMTMERIPVDFRDVLRDVEGMLRAKAAAQGLELRVVGPSSAGRRFYGDPTRLRQILMNLAGNALKFTEQGGVTIRARVEPAAGGERLRVDVADTGPGMSTEQSAMLFRPFTQADVSVTRKFGGTGLGLTISRRLARMMGGDVHLTATAPGVGTTFELELPLEWVPEPSRPGLPDSPAAAKSSALRGRILLAEDGVDNQRLVSLILRKAGAEVVIAENGQVALDLFIEAENAARPFDLIVSDLQMPEIDGFTLARLIRERGSAVPLVALTADVLPEVRTRCEAAGFDDFATKPIDRARLIEICARGLEQTAAPV